jgi:lactate permease
MGKPANTAYVLNYLGATGTLLFVSGLLTLIWLQSTPVLDWMVP